MLEGVTATASTNGVTAIPNGKIKFGCDGASFELDLVSTIKRMDDLRIAHENRTHWEYLDAVIQLVQEMAGVLLNYGQADWLDDHLTTEYVRIKKKRTDELLSLRSTVSTRSV